MRKVDNTGRIALPKELRERRGIKEGDIYDIIEQGNDIILRSVAPTYTITEKARSKKTPSFIFFQPLLPWLILA